MHKKILTLGASSSSKSINKKFATYAAQNIDQADVTALDLNDFEMPIYSSDRENQSGIPDLAHRFKQHLRDADGIIISFAEHNGAYSAAFKNIMDWTSRIDGGLWENKDMLLLSTSPGGRGGKTVLSLAVNSFPHMAAKTIHSFSLPAFHKNFSDTDGITDEELSTAFNKEVNAFTEQLNVD